jgi:hypothetical protein
MFDLTVSYDAELHIIRTTTFGRLDFAAIRQMAVAGSKAGAEHGTERHLIDHRNVDLAVGILEISDIPAENQKLGVKASVRVAIICRDERSVYEKFQYLEDLYFIEGIKRQVFTDEQTALDWLTRNTPD